MIHVSISAIRLRAYSIVLILTLASTVALAGSMPVSGGGTLNWIDSYPQKNCWVGGQYNYNGHQYGGIFSNAFSYTDVSGHVTNDPNAQLTYSGSPGGASCPPPGWTSGGFSFGVGAAGTVTVSPIPGVDNITAVLTPPPPPTDWRTAYLSPRYVVVGVTYAPPGSQSNVTYENNTYIGNTTKVTDTFQSGHSVGITVSKSFGAWVPGSDAQFGVKVANSDTWEWTQTSGSSSSVTLSKAADVKLTTTGTGDPFAPVDHDYDIIWLWLNPQVIFSVDYNNATNVR